ncbi:MAG TPA: enoyl-CoA hydratase-related protein [Umezawaea sp.]|nr:enoyl-CoA hydratase-related protein [Umezawaea sp.]
MSEHLVLDTAGQVATLTLDRPAKHNAISYDMWSSLPGVLDAVRNDDEIRVLVLQGGKHFSAGADISEFPTLRNDGAGAARYNEAVHRGELALAGLGKPTIAAISGFCIGGGCQIALACDIRIAESGARFGITPAKLGIVYTLTSSKRLTDAVGPAWAKQILFGAEIVDASTALRIGLVNEVHEPEALQVRVKDLAETIASRAQVSVRAAKTIITRVTDGDNQEDDSLLALYDEAVHSTEYAEGITAFREKRSPRF